MKYYDKDLFTYGAELEYADVYRFNELPEGSEWNTVDITTVNSSGIANDPLGKLWKYAGEINTCPTDTIDEQIEVIDDIHKMLNPKPWINYRCNLHIHIGVPGLSRDLTALKKLLRYIKTYEEDMFQIVEPIPKPFKIDFSSEEAFKGALKRYRRRLVSHQHKVSDNLVKLILSAETCKEFWHNHAVRGKKNELLWYITPRASINLRQLFETRTIEFRHFPGTVNLDEYYSCLLWCREFTYAALNDHKWSPIKIYKSNRKQFVNNFPKFRRYIHDIDLIWRKTNLRKNSRGEIRKAIELLIENDELLDIKKYRRISSEFESGYPSQKGIKKWI